MGEKRKRKGAKKRIEVTQLLNKQAEESSKRDTFDGEVLDQVDKFDLEREVLYLDKDNERQNESDDDEEEIHPLDVNSSDGEEYDEEFSDEQSGRDDFESGDDESFEDEVNKTNDAMASDLEDADGEYDDYYDENPETLTVSKSWGKKVSAYYGTDYVKKGKTKIEAEDLQDEEEEAAMAHKRAHMSQLHEDDFGLEEIVAKTISDKSEETPDALVVPTYATIEEKVANLKLRSPELETMIDEFNQINEDLEKHVKPKLLKIGRIVGSRTLTNEQKLVQLKFSVYSHYLMCLSCYFMFKLRKENTDNHPVTEKLLEYRKFMTKIDKIEKSLEKQKRDKPQSKFKANASGLNEISETPHFENDHLELYEKLKKYQEAKKLINLEARQKAIDDEKAAAEEVKRKFERNMGPKDLIVEKDGVSKRKASKAVKSNRSIFEMRALAYKKTKNPRTKNRKKSEVAVVKRRGQVRDLKEVRERYSGEASGINVHTIRGTKLK